MRQLSLARAGCGVLLVSMLLVGPRLLHAQSRSSVSIALGAGRRVYDLGDLRLQDPGAWGVGANVSWLGAVRHPVRLSLDIDGWSGSGDRLLALSPAVRVDVISEGRAYLSAGPGMASEWTADGCIGFAVAPTVAVRASRVTSGCGYSSRQFLLAAFGAGVAGRISDRVRVTLRGRYLWALTAPGDHHPNDVLPRMTLPLAGVEVR